MLTPTTPVPILHIEDDELYASLVQLMLTEDDGSSAYAITQVESLKGALLQLKNHKFEAVLLDLSLGDISGLDNVRAIRLERPDLPLIVLSGHDSKELGQRVKAAGARDFLPKGQASEGVLRAAIASSLVNPAI